MRTGVRLSLVSQVHCAAHQERDWLLDPSKGSVFFCYRLLFVGQDALILQGDLQEVREKWTKTLLAECSDIYKWRLNLVFF